MTALLSRRSVLATLGGMMMTPRFAAAQRVVQFGLTSVVVRENVAFFDRWKRYLGNRIGYPVQFVQRRSYREIMELLEVGQLDFAWICGYPFIRRRDPEFLDLLAVPLFEGAPLYRSYIIVHADSPHQTIADLKGRVFAFSDPDSNSGYLSPRATLAHTGKSPDTFFRLTFFTYNHAETVEAVANRVADGGAVDSYVWEYLKRTNPALAGRTRVIDKSGTFGFPPLVARRGGDAALNAAMRTALLGMSDDDEGRALLKELALGGFGVYDASLYDDIRLMAQRLSETGIR